MQRLLLQRLRRTSSPRWRWRNNQPLNKEPCNMKKLMQLLQPLLQVSLAAFAGLRGSGSWGTDERPTNFREMILWRRPNGSAPLTALLSKTKSEKVDDPQFSWWEEELNAIRIQTDAGFSTTANNLTTDTSNPTAQDLVAGDVLLVEAALTTSYAHEILVVSSVSSATGFVAKRGQAGS